MLLGVRGYPLGEHGRVGGLDARLYAEQLHVPWLIRFPDGAGRLARSSRLVSSLDVLPTLVEWIDGGERRGGDRWDGASVLPLVRSAKSPGRDALLCGGSATGYRAIRTPAWSLRYEASAGATGSGHGPELFVRPDDRWEANDVAALCPDIVEALSVEGEGMAGRIQAGEAMPTPSIAQELRMPLG
jgi:arylsulfatase A-like enzyme